MDYDQVNVHGGKDLEPKGWMGYTIQHVSCKTKKNVEMRYKILVNCLETGKSLQEGARCVWSKRQKTPWKKHKQVHGSHETRLIQFLIEVLSKTRLSDFLSKLRSDLSWPTTG